MNLGSAQTVLICAPSADGATVAPCGVGQAPHAIQAYVLDVDSAAYLMQLAQPVDRAEFAAAFGYGITSVLMFWLVAKGVGTLINMFK